MMISNICKRFHNWITLAKKSVVLIDLFIAPEFVTFVHIIFTNCIRGRVPSNTVGNCRRIFILTICEVAQTIIVPFTIFILLIYGAHACYNINKLQASFCALIFLKKVGFSQPFAVLILALHPIQSPKNTRKINW